jgi:hypothetical protein
MTRYMPSPLRRLHQLNGPNGINPSWALANQLNFKFNDIPQTMTALGRKHVNYVSAIRLSFAGTLTSTGGVVIPRKVQTPLFISSVQIQGTELGSPVSSSHMLGGIIDTNSFIRSGGQNNLWNSPGITLAAGVGKAVKYSVDIYLGNFSQRSGHQTCPLALFLQPGEIIVNTPATLASVDASLADVTLSACTVTAQAVILPDTEIRICNPWQMTRHKANSGSGADSVMLNSFGANSTLTGVQSKAGIHSILWAGSGLQAACAGPGTVASITQFAADFLGLRQNNDPRAIVQELFSELTDGKVIDTAGVYNQDNALYPFFDLQHPALTGLDLLSSAEFFPVMFPVRNFDASKLLDAVGNPSYDLTGTFTPGANHYSYVEACYPLTMEKINDLVAVIQRSHMGSELYGTDDLIPTTKLADSQNLYDVAVTEPAKLTYLPRLVVPRANPAVK